MTQTQKRGCLYERSLYHLNDISLAQQGMSHPLIEGGGFAWIHLTACERFIAQWQI